MSKSMNPYEILQIDDFSSQEEVEAAFHQRVAEFDGIEKLTKKQTDLYTLIHESYDILSNQNTKKMFDDDLRLKNISNQNVRINEHLSPLDDENSKSDDVETVELSREKKIGIKGTNNSKNLSSYFFYGIVAILIGGYFLNVINQDKADQEANKEKVAKVENTEKPVQEPPQPINLIASTTDIKDNILYPDPIAFRNQNLIYAPDGSVFPLQAGLIQTLPQTVNGEGSIVVQNPHATAIFGKLIVQFAESSEPMAIRYFYIPAKQSLELFRTPSGRFQIQILTLDKPIAYVSPIFTVPLYSTNRVIQKADWAFPHAPETVF